MNLTEMPVSTDNPITLIQEDLDRTSSGAVPTRWLPVEDVPLLRDDALLMTNPGLAIPYICVLTILMLTGVIGNIAIIGAISISSKLKYAGYELVINQAVADLCVTAIAEPTCLIGK